MVFTLLLSCLYVTHFIFLSVFIIVIFLPDIDHKRLLLFDGLLSVQTCSMQLG